MNAFSQQAANLSLTSQGVNQTPKNVSHILAPLKTADPMIK